jgi:hypothetical protein
MPVTVTLKKLQQPKMPKHSITTTEVALRAVINTAATAAAATTKDHMC